MEANIYCFICRRNWWILVFAKINSILSWARTNSPPGRTCCLRQRAGNKRASWLKARSRASTALPLKRTCLETIFFSLIWGVCFNFEFYFCDQMLIPTPFPHFSRTSFFYYFFPHPWGIRNSDVIQLGDTYLFECWSVWLGVLSEPNLLLV